MAVSVYSWRVAGIEPPGVRSAPRDARRAYWQTVVSLVMEVKDRELAAGLDRRGRRMHPIHRLTKIARRDDINAVTGRHPYSPMGKAHPLNPPLQSTGSLSRTRTLLRGKVDGDGAVFWWDTDPHTGKDWGMILNRHRHGFDQRFRYPQRGWGHVAARDVFGISPRGLADVKQRAAQWWTNLGAGLARHAAPPQPAARRVAGGTIEYEAINYQPYHIDVHTPVPLPKRPVTHPGDYDTGWRVLVPKQRQPPAPPAPPKPASGPKPKGPPKPPALPAPGPAKPTRVPGKQFAEQSLGVKFKPSEAARTHKDVTVTIDVGKARAALAKGSEIDRADKKYTRVVEFLAFARARGVPVEQSRVGLSAEGELVIIDGRHRFAAFADEGAIALPVSVSRTIAAELLRLFAFILLEL